MKRYANWLLLAGLIMFFATLAWNEFHLYLRSRDCPAGWTCDAPFSTPTANVIASVGVVAFIAGSIVRFWVKFIK